eukprot:Gregarina_sp_Pseudo_9__1553@NODE_2040_length_1185_cov_12_983421_g1884_i0_p2_GENE_NODE_2040_length_1185_cov_12_983421_g1884_i0NODE_2040_length_1185_cov_12_983421_g1884_i0_p2_ORF_typecomplete_len175_score40_90_NODE_2040_length_1185_cov_12_983421_g1884_i0314838
MIFDSVRISGDTVRAFAFRRLPFPTNAQLFAVGGSRENRPPVREMGEIRVDVFWGLRASAAYTPILRFCNQDVEQECPAVSALVLDSKAMLRTAALGVSFNGPARQRCDRRRKFERSCRVCRFVFRYCDPRWIEINNLTPPQPVKPPGREAVSAITVHDDDDDDGVEVAPQEEK